MHSETVDAMLSVLHSARVVGRWWFEKTYEARLLLLYHLELSLSLLRTWRCSGVMCSAILSLTTRAAVAQRVGPSECDHSAQRGGHLRRHESSL